MNAKVTPALGTPTDLKSNAVGDIAGALRILLADVFALYIKTKNFHWHMSGPHFRDYHLLLDEQSDQIFAMTDDIAERARKIGGTTLRSIGQINKLKRVLDNDAEFVTPLDMLAELRDDNKQLTAHMRETHDLCDEHGDVATTSLLENWIDETERRTWFLFEACRTRNRQPGRDQHESRRRAVRLYRARPLLSGHDLHGSGDRPDLGSDRRIFRGHRFDIADLDIGRDDARPFGAGAEKPARAHRSSRPSSRAV